MVDVRDVARAHVLAMQRRDAIYQRVVLVSAVAAWRDIIAMVKNGLPSNTPPAVFHIIPSQLAGKDTDPAAYPQALTSIRGASRLGLAYRPLEDTLADTAKSLVDGGYLGIVGTIREEK